MFKTLLIANRGEIASRIIRTCKKMGIRSVAIFSQTDRHLPYVKQADMAVCIGENAPSESYLNQEKIIEVAKEVQAEAIHPGYGFLSENVDFSRKCKNEGIQFVGPHAAAIQSMASKAEAKKLMKENGVPVVPGYEGKEQAEEKLKTEAEKIGYPILLKATAGGGGKGMRIVRSAEDLGREIQAAKREALNAFGNDELILEKYIESGRHIEIQIFGDKQGNVISLLERECSLQRRYQKVMEESPSPVMTESLRARMCEAALLAAKAIQYDNAGTVEFIYDDENDSFYFLEVNTRLQVEHPVTEEITGLDLVQMQIESAAGIPLQLQQEDIQGKGYAIEVRLYAEDPENDFMPCTGKIEKLYWPEVKGLRIETGVESGSEISVYYDPMIAKLIVWDQDRSSAHRKMKYVLSQLNCLGLTTNQAFLLKLLSNEAVEEGEYNTNFIGQKMTTFYDGLETAANHSSLIAATLYNWNSRQLKRGLLKAVPSGWRNSFYEFQKEIFIFKNQEIKVEYRFDKAQFQFRIKDKEYLVSHLQLESGLSFECNGIRRKFEIATNKNNFYLQNEEIGSCHLILKDRFPIAVKEKVKGTYEAPMPSQVISILVEAGQTIKQEDPLFVLSSMKMENTIYALEEGMVEAVFVQEGSNVEAGKIILKITEN